MKRPRAFPNSFDFSNLREIINDAYYPALTDKSRYLLMFGGAGSGKSHFTAQKILLRTAWDGLRGIKHRAFAVRKTIPEVRRSCWRILGKVIDAWGWNEFINPNKTLLTYEVENGSEIICTGIDDPEKFKSAEGPSMFWLEESTGLKIADIEQMDRALRGNRGTYNQMMFTFNPISKFSAVYKKFFENKKHPVPDFNWLIQKRYLDPALRMSIYHTTWRDNVRFLDPDSIKTYQAYRENDTELFTIYDQGAWGEITDIVYQDFKRIKKWPDGLDEVWYGVDWGTATESACIKLGRRLSEPTKIYVQQILYETDLITSEFKNELKLLIPRGSLLYVDNAEKDRVIEFSMGGDFIVEPSVKIVDNKRQKAFIVDFVKRYQTFITEDSQDFFDELAMYKWRKVNGVKMDEPIGLKDHLIDAYHYGMVSHLLSELTYDNEEEKKMYKRYCGITYR